MDVPSGNMFDALKDPIWEQLGPQDSHWFDVLTIKASKEEEKSPDSQLCSTPKIFRRNRILSPETQHGHSFSEQDKEPLPWVAMALDLSPGQQTPASSLFRNMNPLDSFYLLDTPQRTLRMVDSLGAQVNPDMSWTSALNTPSAVPSTLILTKSEKTSPVDQPEDKHVIFVRKLFPSLSNVSGVEPLPPTKRQAPSCHKASQEEMSSDSLQSLLDQSDNHWKQTLPNAIDNKDHRNSVASILEGDENILSMFFTNSSSALRRVKTEERIKRKRNLAERGCGGCKDVLKEKHAERFSETEDQKPEVHNLCPATSSHRSEHEMNSDHIGENQWSPISLTEISDSVLDPSDNIDDPGKQWESGHLPEQLENPADTAQIIRPLLKAADSIYTKKTRLFVYTVPSPKLEVSDENEQTKEHKESLRVAVPGQQQRLELRDPMADQNNCVNSNNIILDATNGTQPLDAVEEHGPVPSMSEKGQDLDMSQLCRVFDQDFTQMSEVFNRQGNVNEGMPQSGLACPSSVKQTNTRLLTKRQPSQGETSPRRESNSNTDEAQVTPTYRKSSDNSYMAHDSGFLSCVTRVTEITGTSLVASISENGTHGEQLHGFKSGFQKHVPLSPLIEEKERSLLKDFEGGPNEYQVSLNEAMQNHLGIKPMNTKVDASMLVQDTNFKSGFKTASNKGINISSMNFERAKDIFKEVEDQSPCIVQPAEHDNITRDHITQSDKSTQNNVVLGESCGTKRHPLTASQKADVTELCNLLEEANTQFEFTQFKPAKPTLHSQDNDLDPKATEEELDPDFLAGLDYDDSFTSDGEKHLGKTKTPNETTSIPKGWRKDRVQRASKPSVGASFQASLKKDTPSVIDVSIVTEHDTDVSVVVLSNEHADNEDLSGLKGNVGFQTAGGSLLSVSEKCLSKAKALFADMENAESCYLELNCVKASPPHGQQNGKDHSKGKTQNMVYCHMAQNGCVLDIKEHFHPKFKDQNTVEISERVFMTESPFCKNQLVPNVLSDKHTTEKTVLENGNPLISEGRSKPKGGFKMASGKGITISAQAVQAANGFFKECDAVETHDCVPPNHWKHDIVDLAVTDYEKKGLVNAANTFMKAVTKLAGLESANAGPSVNRLESHHNDMPKGHCGFKKPMTTTDVSSISGLAPPKEQTVGGFHHSNGFSTASGKQVSLTAEALAKAQTLLNECDALEDEQLNCDALRAQHVPSPLQCSIKPVVSRRPAWKAKSDSSLLSKIPEDVGSSAIVELSGPRGFSTASGKMVSVSNEALTKAKTLLNQCDPPDDGKEQILRRNQPSSPNKNPPKQNGGFQTASGKGVVISAPALQKAKALLSDCLGDVEDPIHSNVPTNDTRRQPGGFHAANGKPVHVSSEALQKAQSIFNDFSCNTETPALSHTIRTEKNSGNPSNNPEEIRFSFTTAKVPVSEKNLKAAKQLLTEYNGGCTSSTSSARLSHEKLFSNPKLELGKENGLRTLSTGDIPKANMQNWPIPKTTPGRTKALISLGQNKRLKGDEMDDSNALLSGEHLAIENITVTSEKMPVQSYSLIRRSEETRGATGKRSAEDVEGTDQPPLKRRLLEEFDQAVEGDRATTLQPAKSCSHGVTKDRRVFTYRVLLKPNITGPQRDARSFAEYRDRNTPQGPATQRVTLGDTQASGSRPPAFVPPFLKTTRSEAFKSPDPQVKASSSAVFIPPFKRQQPSVRGSSTIPKTAGDKLPLPSVTPDKNNPHLPPTAMTTNGIVEGTESRGKGKGYPSNSCHGEMSSGHPRLPVEESNGASAIEDWATGNQDVLQDLLGAADLQGGPDLLDVGLARDIQDMRIRKKSRQTVSPLPGSLFLAKTSGLDRIPLRAAVNGLPPRRYSCDELYGYGIRRPVSEVTGENAESFRLCFRKFFRRGALDDGGGVQLADGGWLVPREDGTVGKEEFYRALCDSPGVDVRLISQDWVSNHYRWVVWKLASMERSFPASMACLWLNPEQILLQLKYRYDVEVDHSRRPALRKIMERDDTAAKTMVLCVCGVVCWGPDPSRRHPEDLKTPGGGRHPEDLKTPGGGRHPEDLKTPGGGRHPEDLKTPGGGRHPEDLKTPGGGGAEASPPFGVVWLTDGWYAIKAQLDAPLTAMLHRKRLVVGGKLMVHGAELVGPQDGCSPLEAPESLMLKINANSSRRARWDAKLGFHRDPRPFLLQLSSLYGDGGVVGGVDLLILRSYPMQWMEKRQDGGFVFRSGRAEEREARRFEDTRNKAMELLYAKIQAQLEKEDQGKDGSGRRKRRTLCHQDLEKLQDGEELHEAVENDPAYLEACLSETQLETLQHYRRSLVEKRQGRLQERCRRALEQAQEGQAGCVRRDVTPVWKLSVADASETSTGSVYMLNLWRPSADLQSLLKEGSRCRVHSLAVSQGKKQTSGAALQFTATSKTHFQDVQVSQEWSSAHFQARKCANFLDLLEPDFQPLCGEVDLVGYVISSPDAQASSPTVYLGDATLNVVKVRWFSSLAQSGLEELVRPGALLAASNLQHRACSSPRLPILYAGDLSSFSTNPREAHLQEALRALRNQTRGQERFLQRAEEKLAFLVQTELLTGVSTPQVEQSTTAASTAVGRPRAGVCGTPLLSTGRHGSFTPQNLVPPPDSIGGNSDPKSLKRRRALEYLSRVPSPPPLSALGSPSSFCVKKTFNPPRRAVTAASGPLPAAHRTVEEDEWENDEGLARIDTQDLHGTGLGS